MNTLLFLNGLGFYELLIIFPVFILFIISPFMWFAEWRSKRYWKKKAEDYERRILGDK